MDPVEIRGQLTRILSSAPFAQAERASRFLAFIVETTLDGRGDEIKEYTIAVEVFQRKDSFDPRLDSVVRVEASRLRAKLREYYESDGKDDPIRIEVPKGAYVPVFAERVPAAAAALPPIVEAVPARPAGWRIAALTAAAVTLAAAWYFGVHLSHAVARASGGKAEGEIAGLRRPPGGNSAAYDALLKAHHNSTQYMNSGSSEYYAQAEQLLRKAIAMEPAYPDALVEMGLLYGRRYQMTGEAPWLRAAETEFRKALALDACQPVANAVLSSVVREAADFDAAVAIGRKAVECDDRSAQAHNALGLTYMYMGFYESAEAEFRRGVECDRLFLSPYLNVVEVLLYEKRPADAVAASKEAVQVEPRSGLALFELGSALLANGEFGEAEKRWDEAVRISPQQFAALRDVVTALMQFERGDPAPGRAILARYRGRAEFRSVLWSAQYVDLCVRADEIGAALECLDRSPHFREYRGMITDPALARLRGDPRFAALLAKRRARWESDVARYGPSLAVAPPKL